MLPIGTILHGTYRVGAYLSSGGFGNTYIVTNLTSGAEDVGAVFLVFDFSI